MGGVVGVLTADDLRARYTMKEVKRADEAAKITRNLGFPSAPVVNKLLGGGSIERTRVKVRDNKNAIDMNGKPVEFLRGKQVKRKAEVAWVPPLKRHRESASLHTDIMFIAEEPYLVSVLVPTTFGIVTWMINNRSAANIKRCVSEQLRLARSRGFIVETIYVDAEKGLERLKGTFEEVHVDVAGAG